jgi:hypothetical protein
VKTKADKIPSAPEKKEAKTSRKNNIESQYFCANAPQTLFAATLLTLSINNLNPYLPRAY